MTRRRLLVTVCAVVAVALPLSVAHAASQSTAAKTLGTGSASVSPCDTNGITILYNLSGSNVSSVTVGSIGSACATGTLSVDVDNGSANSSGSGTVPAGGGSMTVTLASAVALTDHMEADATISGP